MILNVPAAESHNGFKRVGIQRVARAKDGMGSSLPAPRFVDSA